MGPADKSSAQSAALFCRGRPRTTRHEQINERLDAVGVGEARERFGGFSAPSAAAPLQNATFVALKVSTLLHLASSTYPPRLLRNANAADTRAGPGRVHASFAAEAPRPCVVPFHDPQLQGGFPYSRAAGASPSHRSKNRAHLALALAAARSLFF